MNVLKNLPDNTLLMKQDTIDRILKLYDLKYCMEKVHVGSTQKILKIIGSYFGNSRLRQAIGQVKATETSHK